MSLIAHSGAIMLCMSRQFGGFSSLLALIWLLWSAAAFAQQPNSQCYPVCRLGYLCNAQGQCVSACNPPCGDAQVCTPAGACISACNPACPIGQQCQSNGTCLAQQIVAPQPPPSAYGAPQTTPPQRGNTPPFPSTYGAPVPPPGTVYIQPTVAQPDVGWARAAGIIGIVASVLMTGNVIASAIYTGDSSEEETARATGIAATLLFGTSVPIVAVGGASARRNPNVHGSSALRILGWIGYGLAVADAIAMIAISFGDEVSSAMIASVGALALLSEIFFIIDAFGSASEAEDLGSTPPVADGIRLIPSVSVASDEGGVLPTFGLGGTF